MRGVAALANYRWYALLAVGFLWAFLTGVSSIAFSGIAFDKPKPPTRCHLALHLRHRHIRSANRQTHLGTHNWSAHPLQSFQALRRQVMMPFR